MQVKGQQPGLANAFRRAGGLGVIMKPVATPAWWLTKTPGTVALALAFTVGSAFSPAIVEAKSSSTDHGDDGR